MYVGRIVVASLSMVVVVACGAAARDGKPVAGQPPEPSSFVVRDARVFDGERVLERATVVVRAGRIVAVGPAAPPADLPVIDGRGRTLLPGFIDAHAHATKEVHLRDALRFGVTAVLDMFTHVDFMAAHRAQRDRLVRTELADLYSAGAPVSSAGSLPQLLGMELPTIAGPDEAERFVDDRLAEGSAYIKVIYEPEVGIMTSVSGATLAAAVRAAHARGALVPVHVSSMRGARDAIAAGADGLTNLVGDEVIDDALLRQIVARRMFVTPTLWIFAALDGAGIGPSLATDPRLAPWLSPAQREGLGRKPPGKDHPMASYIRRYDYETAAENVRRLRAAGVPLLAGDDAPDFGGHGVSLHGELELLVHAGLTPAEALRAATRTPADVFGLADRGRIAAGARADLSLVDGTPVADFAAPRAIVEVF